MAYLHQTGVIAKNQDSSLDGWARDYFLASEADRCLASSCTTVCPTHHHVFDCFGISGMPVMAGSVPMPPKCGLQLLCWQCSPLASSQATTECLLDVLGMKAILVHEIMWQRMHVLLHATLCECGIALQGLIHKGMACVHVAEQVPRHL